MSHVHNATQQSKEAKAGVSARLMTDLSKHVPAATQVVASRLVLRAGMSMTSRVCNLFISNVPGPQLPLYMNGAKQVGAFGLAPLVNGMGLFIATPSYNGMMGFNVTSTRDDHAGHRILCGLPGRNAERIKGCRQAGQKGTRTQENPRRQVLATRFFCRCSRCAAADCAGRSSIGTCPISSKMTQWLSAMPACKTSQQLTSIRRS